jgi:predicted protein tyrosine phosphatase
MVAPNMDDARAIIEFAHATRHVDGTVLFSCQGGVSRSAAAAMICLAAWTGKGREEYCAEMLLRVRPCASPNRSLIRFGDELLQRDGRLICAVRSAR